MDDLKVEKYCLPEKFKNDKMEQQTESNIMSNTMGPGISDMMRPAWYLELKTSTL